MIRWNSSREPLPGINQQQLPTLGQRHHESLSGRQSQVAPSPAGGRLAETHEYKALADLIGATDGGVVRQVIRDSMEKCMLGSDYHMEFVISYALQHAGTGVFGKSLLDFGEDLVRSCKLQIVNLWKQQDITDVAGPLLAKASTDVLDRALAMRLDSIQARALVNALARARRLGYDDKDVVEEKRDGTEVVISAAERNVPAAVAMRQPYRNGASLAGPAPPQRAVGATPGHTTLPHMSAAPPTVPSQHIPPQHVPSQHAPPPPMPQPTSAQAYSTSQQNIEPGPVPSGHRHILYCERCYRPCSGAHALRYHQLKKLCDQVPEDIRQVGSEYCPHCGMRFTSQGGLLYHKRAGVCGHYSQENEAYIWPELEKFYSRKRRVAAPATGQPNIRFNPLNTVSSPPRSATFVSPKSGDDPYSKLSPEARQRLQEELDAATDHFAPLMKAAMDLPESQRVEELAKLKNRYNTKQSMTRKKYGVRLRERRSKEDIESERKRLFGVYADPELTSISGGVPVAKRIRLSKEGMPLPADSPTGTPGPGSDASPATIQTQTPAASPASTPAPAPASGSGSGSGSASAPAPAPVPSPGEPAATAPTKPTAATPTKPAPEVASSGLSETPATAEYTDPTAATAPSATTTSTQTSSGAVATNTRAVAGPVVIPDHSPNTSDDDDEDIPAKLPSKAAS